MDELYEKFITRIRQVSALNSVSGLLSWDQETYMPSKGGETRAEQLALLSSVSHEQFVSDEVGEMLESLAGPAVQGELSDEAAVNVREVKRSYDRKKKLPTKLVEELARTSSLSQQVWIKARKESDFQQFRPWLEKMVDLKKQAAELFGYEHDIYDALLDGYEQGMTVAQLDPMFAELQERTVPLVAAIVESGKKPDREALERNYPADRQKELGVKIAKAMGFDFEAGRLDVSAHPFCSGLSPFDVRMTTRYNENEPLSSLYGVMHETGHGLYEQGLDPRHLGTPMGESISLGIHESQSRLWENLVGRCRAFWEFAFPLFRETFPDETAGLEVDTVHFATNEVTPSLIRVEADEVTYNLHIILRYQIERELLNGRVEVKDLPELWNSRMEELLGLTPPDDARGVMQDIHWSMGGIGYFPTYTLGNLYGAQIFEAARRALPELDTQIRRGEFLPLREWLRENVHLHGRRYQASEMVEKVSGEPAGSRAFLKYMEEKFSRLYGL